MAKFLLLNLKPEESTRGLRARGRVRGKMGPIIELLNEVVAVGNGDWVVGWHESLSNWFDGSTPLARVYSDDGSTNLSLLT